MATLTPPVPILIDASTAATNSILSLTNNFFKAGLNSLIMILVTEIGDKTFFIAAVLAMRNGRLIVYAGAMGKESNKNLLPNLGSLPIVTLFLAESLVGALALMHVLSALMGYALPNLLPRAYTHFASAVSFCHLSP